MEIKGMPSCVSEYEFIICYKREKEDPDTYYFYSVAENGFKAEQDCEEIKNSGKGLTPIIMHNVRIQGVRRK